MKPHWRVGNTLWFRFLSLRDVRRKSTEIRARDQDFPIDFAGNSDGRRTTPANLSDTLVNEAHLLDWDRRGV
jgi:hypothetical protein